MSLLSIWTSIKTTVAKYSPLGNAPAAQLIIFAVIIALLLGFCTYAKASEVDILGGSTVIRGPTGVLAMDVIFPKVIGDYGNLELGLNLIGESNWHCFDGAECNNNQAVVHAEVVAPIPYLGEVGIGVAHLQHSDNYNSGSIDFSLSLEHRIYKNVYIRYQHFSNAGTNAPNAGRDMVLIGWRF